MNNFDFEQNIVSQPVVEITHNMDYAERIGLDGYTPYIGENGNWWINGVDTKHLAQGDAFTFEDFTPEQIEILQQPTIESIELATAAAELAISNAKSAQLAASGANTAAGEATTAARTAEAKAQGATTATISANQAATHATDKAVVAQTSAENANSAANAANDKATYAQQQGDYAKEVAETTDDRLTKAETDLFQLLTQIVENTTDTSMVIAPEDNHVYICGTLTSLTINPIPATGVISVIEFDSGQTATEVTITPSLIWANGNNLTINPDRHYVVVITNGKYATYNEY